jgi:hypothetical protein
LAVKRNTKKATRGLSAKTFKGLSEKRMAAKGGGGGKRLMIKQGDTIPVQFLHNPDDFIEFNIHTFQDEGWNFVPCAGDDCPLCEDEDEKRSRTSYRFACNVYNLKEKKVQIMEGPKDLATRIFHRYQRKPTAFLKRVFDITKFPTTPVTYQMELAEEQPVTTRGLALHDLEDYLTEELHRYYGEEMPGPSALEDDDDEDLDDELDDEDEEEEDDDDLDDEDDDDDLDLDDEDDEDDDDLDDDEDEEEDEDEPPAKPRKAAKKAPAKKAPAKAAKKTSARR